MCAVMVVTSEARITRGAEVCVGAGVGLGVGLEAAKTRGFFARILALTGAVFLVVRAVARAAVVLVGLALALEAGLGAEAEDLAAFLIFFMAYTC